MDRGFARGNSRIPLDLMDFALCNGDWLRVLMKCVITGKALGGSRSSDVELSHAGPQCTRVHAKKLGRSPLPFDSPSRFLQSTEDVVPLHLGKAR